MKNLTNIERSSSKYTMFLKHSPESKSGKSTTIMCHINKGNSETMPSVISF